MTTSDGPLWTHDYPYRRPLGDGTWLVVMPLTFGRGRVCVADEGDAGIEFY